MRQERHFFVALPIPSEDLANIANRLSLSDYFRNVYTLEEYHLTLRFFGPLGEKEQQSWKQQLQEIARTIEPFVLR
ncbi:TPA_asm: RNA 2',3'-cyclic phosphodiesterase, partial [Salmonella enterica subsp. enterica serovar Enteritidis str. P125109]|nr:RNA 2',3'-cyclic phosphodiesterase [Salmonella enterica subsp. enterica serovar Enteritidis str. P125109]